MMTERSRITGGQQFTATVRRRSVLSGSVGVVAAAALPRPHIAKAAATRATVWWQQGFIPEEDAAFRRLVADYEKASGNKIDYSIMPFTALAQKTISALTTGEVPDVNWWGISTITPQSAWDDKLTDVADVMESRKSQFSPTALLSSQFGRAGRLQDTGAIQIHDDPLCVKCVIVIGVVPTQRLWRHIALLVGSRQIRTRLDCGLADYRIVGVQLAVSCHDALTTVGNQECVEQKIAICRTNGS
jgi:hypothetical protein